MTPDAPIRAMREAAARAGCVALASRNECDPTPCSTICRWCRASTDAALIAGLRATPTMSVPPGAGHTWAINRDAMQAFAAAIEAQARADERGDGG